MSLSAVIQRSKAEVENWRYTDLAKLLSLQPANSDAAPAEPPPLPSIMKDAAQRYQLVFIDGAYQAARSRLPATGEQLLQGDATTGYTLIFAGQTCLVTSPIELVFVTQSAAECSIKLTVEIGANARLTLIEHHLGNSGKTAQVIETAFHLRDQAKLVHGKILHGAAQGAHLARSTVTIEQGGYYRNFAMVKDTGLLRNEIAVTLNGKLAQASLDGVMLLQKREHADTTLSVTHAAPHGSSSQLYKSILKDQAHGVFQGRIIVAKDAQKTDGRQLSRALLLSDQCEMDAKPELTIDADDVKCSHGCTIGELDGEALFYLRTRGIDECAARKLLLHSFVGDVLKEIEVEEWRDYVVRAVEEWLHDHA